MSDIQDLTKIIRQFSKERDWDQFHDAKNLAVALSIEASELLECYLWKDAEDANPEKVKEELADVLNYALMMADKLGLDVKAIVEEKIRKNAEKYPIEKAKGTAKKYNEL